MGQRTQPLFEIKVRLPLAEPKGNRLADVIKRLSEGRPMYVHQVARLLGISERTVRWRVQIGTYESERSSPHRTKILPLSVIKHLRKMNPYADCCEEP